MRVPRIHVLERSQRIPQPTETVFEFFSHIANLEEITPTWLGFETGAAPAGELYPGAFVEHTLRLHGVPLRWLTQIQGWQPGRRFVDMQLRGPYAVWHHTHEFAADGVGATVMSDIVRYALPLGPLGELAHPLVRHDLEAIFDFRGAAVARRLGDGSAG